MAVSGSKGNTIAINSLLHRNQGLLTLRVGSTDQEEQPCRIKAPAPAILRVSMHRSMLGDGLWSRLKSSASKGHLPARSAPGTCGDAPADHAGCRPPATPRRHGVTPVRPLDPKRSQGGLPHPEALRWAGFSLLGWFACIRRMHLHSFNRHARARLLADGFPKKLFRLRPKFIAGHQSWHCQSTKLSPWESRLYKFASSPSLTRNVDGTWFGSDTPCLLENEQMNPATASLAFGVSASRFGSQPLLITRPPRESQQNMAI